MKAILVIDKKKAPYSAKVGEIIPVQVKGITYYATVTDNLESQDVDVEIIITGEVSIRKSPKKKKS